MPPSNRAARWTALLAVVALGGCATAGPDFKPPSAPEAGGFLPTGAGAPAGVDFGVAPAKVTAWWITLGSPILDKIIRDALLESPTIAEVDAALQRAQAEADAAAGARAPQVDGEAGLQRKRTNTRSLGVSGFPNRNLNLYTVGAVVTYDLDLFGGRRRATEAAQADVSAEAQRAQAARLALSGNIALQAAEIAAINDELASLAAVGEDNLRLMEMAKTAERAGGATASEIAAAGEQLAQDMAEMAPLMGDLEAARRRLALLAGKFPGQRHFPDFRLADLSTATSIPVAMPSVVLRNRPDILAAEAELHAATARIGVADAARYPNLSLAAGLTQIGLHPDDLFGYDASGWNLGAGMTAPLFDGGTLRARRRAAEAEARGAMSRYQSTVLRAFYQVSDALGALARDDEEIAALVQTKTAADRRLGYARRAYELGGDTLRMVVEAQRRANNAQREVVQAQGRRLRDYIQLLAATAGSWTPPSQPGP